MNSSGKQFSPSLGLVFFFQLTLDIFQMHTTHLLNTTKKIIIIFFLYRVCLKKTFALIK